MKVVALSGGVGGARLVHGLAQVLPAEDLTIIGNTGDDLEHWGLTVCPDLDTLMYTLSGLADEARGWGLEGETWEALARAKAMGMPDWFALGDRDLATHLARSAWLREGTSLAAVTARLCRAVGVRHPILPMSDAPCPTFVHTEAHGRLPFQHWLVRHRAPAVTAVEIARDQRPAAGVLDALRAADLVVLPPSNPYVSIDPILAVAGIRAAVAARPVVALSPIVCGRAVKGPLAAMVRELSGAEPGPAWLLDHYRGLIDALVVERGDAAGLSVPALQTATVMGGAADRARLAAEVLQFGADALGVYWNRSG